MHDIVQGRAPAVQGYILWGSVQSGAKGKGTAGDDDIRGKLHRNSALKLQRPWTFERKDADKVTIGDVGVRYCRDYSVGRLW